MFGVFGGLMYVVDECVEVFEVVFVGKVVVGEMYCMVYCSGWVVIDEDWDVVVCWFRVVGDFGEVDEFVVEFGMWFGL